MKKIKTLCLCGGGIYGYAEIGAIAELEKYKENIEFDNIIGVSVGSIIGTLYAVGYTSAELDNIIYQMNFDKLIKGSGILSYVKLFEKYGLYEATDLENEIEKLISQKTCIKNCTFAQIPKKLQIVATNLNYQKPYVFDKENTPDMIVSKAVRMSIAYPGIISPVLYRGDYYGDGGITINYPIMLSENLDETIGLLFISSNENDDGTLKHKNKINNVYDFASSIANTLARSAYILQLKKEYLEHSIMIRIERNYSSMNTILTLEEKDYIYACGVNAVKEQIKKII